VNDDEEGLAILLCIVAAVLIGAAFVWLAFL
jgi:hypothetical protein